MPMTIMELVSLGLGGTDRSIGDPNRGDTTLLLSQIGRSSWRRPAAIETRATKAEINVERASRPHQRDIGIFVADLLWLNPGALTHQPRTRHWHLNPIGDAPLHLWPTIRPGLRCRDVVRAFQFFSCRFCA